ncbi:hypothetical protein CB1_000152018 [Camelus ferus]|nr:hypothetical protein CB1_000152018 [Camelus ferus]
MRTNYEILVSLGSQQAVSSGEAHRHSQVDPLQSQCFSEPLFGKSDVSFRLDQAVNLLRPHRRDTRTLISIVYSSPEGVPSPRTLGLPGFQEISSWVGLLHLCPVCGESFWKKNLLEQHQRNHSRGLPYGAWKQFSKQADTQQPQSIPRGQRHFRSPECGRGFHWKQCLLRHLAVHAGESPLQGPECKVCFPPERTHGERPFRCPECSKSFRLKGILKAHQRTHSRERPFQCGECGKGFTRPSKLAEHFRVHSGERPFGCPDCGRRFRLKGQLRSHQRLHTGERPFPCPDCGKRYRVKADMKAHRLLHGGQMPFSCECGKGFAKQSKLVEHVRTHTGEKPFQCPKCDKSFRLKAQLLSHQGLHTGERPFRCPECGKSFRERGHMLRHQRIHRPERPFSCADCGKGFIYKSKLAEHIRVHTKSCRTPSEPDVKKRLSQLFAMIEADWS